MNFNEESKNSVNHRKQQLLDDLENARGGQNTGDIEAACFAIAEYEASATVRVGTVIQSEYGQGPVVAITKKWVIQSLPDGKSVEVALLRDGASFWILATDLEVGGGQDETIKLPPAEE